MISTWCVDRYIYVTHINECLERQVVCHFLIDPIRSDRVIRNVFHICIPKIQGSVEQSCSNRLDVWVLFSLNLMKVVNEFLVMLVEFRIVVENFVNELLQPITVDDRWFCIAQRDDINLFAMDKRERM